MLIVAAYMVEGELVCPTCLMNPERAHLTNYPVWNVNPDGQGTDAIEYCAVCGDYLRFDLTERAKRKHIDPAARQRVLAPGAKGGACATGEVMPSRD